jgi:hypothetical protein
MIIGRVVLRSGTVGQLDLKPYVIIDCVGITMH